MSFQDCSPDHGCFCFLELGHTEEFPGISNVMFPTCGCFPACLSHERCGGSSSWLLGISSQDPHPSEGMTEGTKPEGLQTPGAFCLHPIHLALPLGFPSVWQEIHQGTWGGMGGSAVAASNQGQPWHVQWPVPEPAWGSAGSCASL